MVGDNTITNKPALRESSFELLRIISILLIIAHHFAVHGGFDLSISNNSYLINYAWISLLANSGKIGVVLFFLISSYFLVNGRFRLKKIITIFCQVLFYSITLGVVFLCLGRIELSFTNILKIIFPLGSELWWFMTYYLLMYCFSPFLNLAIKKMGRRYHLCFTLFLLITWSVLPTFFNLSYGLSFFGIVVLIYFVGSYISLYKPLPRLKPFVGIILSVLFFLIWFLIGGLISFFCDAESPTIIFISNWFNLNIFSNIFQLCANFMLFLSFSKIKFKNNRLINLIASTTLSIYLLHDHPQMRIFIWKDLFKNSSFFDSQYLIPISLLIVIAVFIVSMLVALVYNYTFGKVIKLFVEYLDKKFLYKIDNVLQRSGLDNETTI